MPELRKDPIISRWVIISPERSKRPVDYDIPVPELNHRSCPFCYGQEHLTPPEIMAVRPQDSVPNTTGWQIRVIANKYPALRVEGELEKSGEGLYDKMSGIGAHEIIVEMPEHNRLLSDLPIPHLQNILAAYLSRMQDLKRDTRLKYLMVFKNQGYRAGASLEHSHSQLIATPIVPKTINEELAGSKEYYNYKERCVFCDIIKQEGEDRRRLVLENERFISIAPFAARFPFECWLLPKKHESNFENITLDDLALLTPILKETLLRIKASVNNPPFNLVIHTAPCQLSGLPHFHWHMEIMPRITRVAGFERGTGFYINPTPPEDCAKFMREVEIG